MMDDESFNEELMDAINSFPLDDLRVQKAELRMKLKMNIFPLLTLYVYSVSDGWKINSYPTFQAYKEL